MQYLIAFLEGVVTFISPCLLPMLPLYASYFAGGEISNTRRTAKNATGFVLGFTAVFVTMGALAGSLGHLLQRYHVIIQVISGLIVILFGLSFLGVIPLKIFKGGNFAGTEKLGFFSSILFGIVFSVGWTPCVGAFLGSALMLAASQGSVWQGIWMLLAYSIGLGIPFFLSALLIDKLKGAFAFIKRHYHVVNIVSGALLILIGFLMATGFLTRLMSILA